MITGGLDEVGWGAYAGPVISVVACFRPEDLLRLPPTTTDSKKLTPTARSSLYLEIIAASYDVGVGHAWPEEIDQLTPMVALQLSYTRALEELRHKPDRLIVDGSNHVESWTGYQDVVPKGDLKHREVSAASIIAKVFRDRIMESYSRRFPAYGWNRNMGYGSQEHEDAIRQHGPVVPDRGGTGEYLHRRRYIHRIVASLR